MYGVPEDWMFVDGQTLAGTAVFAGQRPREGEVVGAEIEAGKVAHHGSGRDDEATGAPDRLCGCSGLRTPSAAVVLPAAARAAALCCVLPGTGFCPS